MKRIFLASVTAVLTIATFSQNLGVGVTNPTYQLDVGNRIRIRNGPPGSSAGLWLNNTNNSTERSFIGMMDDDHVGFYSNSNYWQLIMNLNSGNLGIGTISPATKLHVQGSGEIVTLRGIAPWISLYDNGTLSGSLQGKSKDVVLNAYGTLQPGSDPAGNLLLQVKQGAAPDVYYPGNIGIGVSNPSFLLDVGKRMRVRSEGVFGLSAGIWLNNYNNSAAVGFMGMHDLDNHIGFFGTGCGWQFLMNTNTGNVGIGTINPQNKLEVNGTTRSKEVVVETGWADYVFEKNYKLSSLNELEKFIQQNKHLPNIPSAKEIQEKGLSLGDMQKRMMEKIEEMTLYVIQLKKEIENLKTRKR